MNCVTPYDFDVEALAKQNAWSIDKARDGFIYLGLQYGDVGPLFCFLVGGHVPGLELRQTLAVMLSPEAVWPDVHKQKLRFRLIMKARNGKRGPVKSKFNNFLRNGKLALLVRSYMKVHGRGTYDAAIKTVASKCGEKEQTVRDAYDASARRTRRGNKLSE
jgi:hypothetical protein